MEWSRATFDRVTEVKLAKDPKNALSLENWLNEKFSFGDIIKRFSKGLYYKSKPRTLRLVGVVHWSWKTALASSPPALAFYYGSIAANVAIAAGVAIFAGHAILSALDAMSKEKLVAADSMQSEMFIRLGDLLASHTNKPGVAAQNRTGALRSLLGMLEGYALHATKDKKGGVSVCLILYQGTGFGKMRIVARNPGNLRPDNREVAAESLLGHRVCQTATEPRILDDAREFGDAIVSPTQPKLNYRSIFFIPIESSDTTKPGIRGFISIDSTRPYAFHGNRARDIIVTCEPILSHIRKLI